MSHLADGRLDGCMIGRGALIKPWICTEIKEHRSDVEVLSTRCVGYLSTRAIGYHTPILQLWIGALGFG